MMLSKNAKRYLSKCFRDNQLIFTQSELISEFNKIDCTLTDRLCNILLNYSGFYFKISFVDPYLFEFGVTSKYLIQNNVTITFISIDNHNYYLIGTTFFTDETFFINDNGEVYKIINNRPLKVFSAFEYYIELMAFYNTLHGYTFGNQLFLTNHSIALLKIRHSFNSLPDYCGPDYSFFKSKMFSKFKLILIVSNIGEVNKFELNYLTKNDLDDSYIDNYLAEMGIPLL
ncbi:MAG: hypothetical protein JNJ85_07375 [Candidatus Kapabacteria bacterium]|nr:hypothetical protein [Candidatus Kapabacteria bacterium]